MISALGAATLLGSALSVWRHVGAHILHRIANLQRSMPHLCEGDLKIETHHAHQDEMAAMASALTVFPREHDPHPHAFRRPGQGS